MNALAVNPVLDRLCPSEAAAAPPPMLYLCYVPNPGKRLSWKGAARLLDALRAPRQAQPGS